MAFGGSLGCENFVRRRVGDAIKERRGDVKRCGMTLFAGNSNRALGKVEYVGDGLVIEPMVSESKNLRPLVTRSRCFFGAKKAHSSWWDSKLAACVGSPKQEKGTEQCVDRNILLHK